MLSHERVGIEPGCNDPIFDANNPSFAYNLYDHKGNPNYRSPAADLSLEEKSRRRRLFNDIPYEKGTRYWNREAHYTRTYLNAEVNWHFIWGPRQMFPQGESEEMRDYRENMYVWASRTMGAWKRRRPEIPVSNQEYDSARFSSPVETGVLRLRRRIRDRNRRLRVKEAKTGLGGL
jgi:hypothetical protein